jgi:serine/threonine-protein kinase RsbW
MEITLSLNLPRDAQSVPVARRIVDSAMRTVGVEPSCVDDVSLALTEACTNVLQHAGPGDDYALGLRVCDDVCTIEVTDVGRGFDPSRLRDGEAPVDAEGGRGVQLMQHLVDRVHFTTKPDNGAVVSLEKRLDYVRGSLLERATR